MLFSQRESWNSTANRNGIDDVLHAEEQPGAQVVRIVLALLRCPEEAVLTILEAHPVLDTEVEPVAASPGDTECPSCDFPGDVARRVGLGNDAIAAGADVVVAGLVGRCCRGGRRGAEPAATCVRSSAVAAVGTACGMLPGGGGGGAATSCPLPPVVVRRENLDGSSVSASPVSALASPRASEKPIA